ncbi:5071_t:CDS:1, partial [Funneliformis mosseae]
PQKTLGLLAAYNSFNAEELLQFRRSFCYESGDTVTGSELFPEKYYLQ